MQEQHSQRYFVTGGTGLIGSKLVEKLAQNHHSGTILSRQTSLKNSSNITKSFSLLSGDIHSTEWLKHIQNHDTVINLAGFPLFEKKWQKNTKALIASSRIQGSKNLADGILALPTNQRPKHLIQASAIGYYGTSLEKRFEESSTAGEDFLAGVAKEWEAQALRLKGVIPLTIARIGIVLSMEGGMLKKVLPIFKKGLGGRLGSGKQWMSWIHIQDLTDILYRAACDRNWTPSIYNLTSPNPVTNAQFTKLLSKRLKLPAILPAPKTFLRAMLGEGAHYITNGQYVVAKKLTNSHYPFLYPQIESALDELIS